MRAVRRPWGRLAESARRASTPSLRRFYIPAAGGVAWQRSDAWPVIDCEALGIGSRAFAHPGLPVRRRLASHRATSDSGYKARWPTLMNLGPRPRERQVRSVAGDRLERAASSASVHSRSSSVALAALTRPPAPWSRLVRTGPLG